MVTYEEEKDSVKDLLSSQTQPTPISTNMKTIILASLIAGVAAFAPVAQKASTTALNMAFEDELGAQPPLGFFDPLGLVADGDQEKFDRLRYVEIKHGRICMLAVVGYLTTESGARLPGDIDYSGLKFADIPGGFAAFSAIPAGGLCQLLFFIGLLEANVMKDITGGEFVGDFRNDYIDFGWDSFDEETKLKKRAIELNQGRAAQMGILALMVHEQLGVSLLPN
jgi:Chlorophyll A-B binding protein